MKGRKEDGNNIKNKLRSTGKRVFSPGFAAIAICRLIHPYRAFVTKPERMQFVQTLVLFTAPVFLSMQRNFCRLGYHILLVLLLAWLTLWPKTGFFPHISQILDIIDLLSKMWLITKTSWRELQDFLCVSVEG